MMSRRMVLERVRPLGWAGALARGLAEVADRLTPGYRPEDPYVCGAGHVTTRLSHRQTVWLFEARRLPACRARGCGLPMLRSPIGADLEDTLRRALHADAAALDTNGATPGTGGAAHNNDDCLRESTS